ncbi:Alpha beta-hydrolase [Mycena kentingensis (nom. inval.)]|nr:Alpha beta-hydrolase [Mycena kentingensis (nom. inval.)]
MPVSTLGAACYIGPRAVRNIARHSKRKALKPTDEPEEAQDDIFFDEAFHIVQAFLKYAVLETVESLQKFTNTHIPAAPWASVVPVCIPLSICNDAADVFISWFGPDELKHVVGGRRWWQVRGLEGIDAEWITQKHLLSEDLDDDKLSEQEQNIRKMECLDRVMLYVHGGGYSWGSINTHRYQLIRYARKIEGRVFAVNYRKAPQYPWPCPLQDVLAAYLYLIRPPPGAAHKPISASNIVLAGDSAGGGLCLSMLTVVRDMDLPPPAGAVLISPWVDLTHSLPSVMENTATDIIPEHGFLAKPSVTWPIDLLKDDRVVPSTLDPPPEPGHADQLRPSKARMQETSEHGTDAPKAVSEEYDIDLFEPRPPKVLMKDPKATPLELHSQIQFYATNEQLTHPLVSPILQGSLGNLPPLYILAGDDEVLRDEIVCIAHRAAHPDKYPTRKGTLRDAHRQQENANLYTKPTKVKLHVYDDMCHVLTVFTFTESAKHAYRAIGEFVKHVTDSQNLANDPLLQTSGARTANNQCVSESQTMIRERVDIKGNVRDMEPVEDIAVLRMAPGQIGIIKEQPTVRWHKGQSEYDKKYKGEAQKAARKRRKNLDKADRIIANAREQGLVRLLDGVTPQATLDSASFHTTDGTIQSDRRYGPLDLEDENPPPSAIAKRRDTGEAIALLKKHIYHTAPATHRTIPKLKLRDAVKAAFDPHDDPKDPPKQSVAEAQVRNSIIPASLNGLRVWDVLLGYFTRKTSEKASSGKEAIKKVVN